MTCDKLSEKMPAVAGGAATWSAEEAEHLRACADCRAEWAVVSAGAAVGRGAALDADALAARVLQRLRTEPAVTHLVRTRWLVGLAAAAAAIALFVVPNRNHRAPAGTQTLEYSIDVPGLGALNAAELTDVLDTFDTPWTETSTTDAPSLDDLDPQELERIERSWEI